ncbi:MAG TPA: J domain-containing protein [Kofleriaceae bacterium]|nr:J domain-containing protein [Kofleriaceae bacterium]
MARRKRDYYTVLGVPRDASETDIKRAFRELARQHHPDVNPDGGERFREINEAYAALSDKEQRARYDRWGHPDDGPSGLAAVVDAAQDIINDVFRRRRERQKGKDVRYTLEVTFEEAVFGADKAISLPADASQPARAAREIHIVVPPGMKDGTVKTLRGEGEPGRGGAPSGDLHVLIRIAEHAQFQRDGQDIRSEQTVSFAQAALGAVIDVSTLDGPLKVRIPEGTQPGRVLRIRGKGIPQAAGKNAPRGDHLVTVQIEVPTELTPRQRELIEELARAFGEQHAISAPARKGLLDRVRSLLDE